MTKLFGLLISLGLLLGLMLACGLSGCKGEALSPTEAPSSGEVPEPAGGDEEEISLPSITGGLQSLDSYRSHFKMTFEGTTDGEAEHWAYEMDVEYVRDPFAQHVVIRGTDTGEGFEIIHISDREYIVLGGGQCLSTWADESDVMDAEIFEPDIIGGLADVHRVRPDESVNGILCRHYVFDETAVAWSGFTHAEGEVWVAVEGDYVVRYTLQADGKDPATGDEGHVEWEYEVRDINVPITIEPPPGCEATESEFPIMPDATDITPVGGMLMYASASSFDDVLAFYQKQMPANGWSDTGDSFISPDNAMLSYTKDGRTATITLTIGEDGMVSVLIIGE